MPTVHEILKQSGLNDEQIAALDAKAIAAFTGVLSTAEQERQTAQQAAQKAEEERQAAAEAQQKLNRNVRLQQKPRKRLKSLNVPIGNSMTKALHRPSITGATKRPIWKRNWHF